MAEHACCGIHNNGLVAINPTINAVELTNPFYFLVLHQLFQHGVDLMR